MNIVTRFFQSNIAGGVLLFAAAFLALLAANIPLISSLYSLLLDTPVHVQIGALAIEKPLLLWVNDGLMAFFFLLVGLELKHEFLEGEFKDKRKIVLPGLGAVGGMLVPALVYVAFNYGDPDALRGWAIPAATDIAFALGVLSLLGERVPLGLKVFLTSLAIFDDIGAILIIALFYTSNISGAALIIAAVCVGILFVLNRCRVWSIGVYAFIGLIMWVAMLKSGVHATLAGVLLAMFIPANAVEKDGTAHRPLKLLEHDLHPVVYFFTLPLFAFCNAGISFEGVGLAQLTHSIPMGIAAGLVFGKQIGIMLFCMIPVALGWLKLPDGMKTSTLYGVSALCGIGFTMSLFIGALAFEQSGVNRFFDERLGILMGSLISGLLGYWVLKTVLPKAG